MKRIHLIVLAFVSLTAATCGGEKTLVKETAYGYLDAMGNYRISDARPYSTPETQKATLDYFEQSIMPFVPADDIKRNTPAKITIKSVRMVDDTTAKAYYRKVTPIKVQNDSLSLVKRNGEWKVNLVIQRSRTLDAMQRMVGVDKGKKQQQDSDKK